MPTTLTYSGEEEPGGRKKEERVGRGGKKTAERVQIGYNGRIDNERYIKDEKLSNKYLYMGIKYT